MRPAFSRKATFQWFVILLWGIVLSTQAPAITSYLNALGLGLKGQRVYVGDGIKVSKVSALGLLLGAGEALFASPIIFKL